MAPRLFASLVLVVLLTTVPGTPSPQLLIAASAVALAALAACCVSAPREAAQAGLAGKSPGAVDRDERCCRGSFRRQSHPGAPGRALPRAPQLA